MRKRNRVPIIKRVEKITLLESDILHAEHGITQKSTKRFFWNKNINTIVNSSTRGVNEIILFMKK